MLPTSTNPVLDLCGEGARLTMTPIKVVIADDHPLFRDGLRRMLSLEKDILVIGEAADGDELAKTIERTKPDILLLDLKMPKGEAVQNLLGVSAKSPSTQVMVLTAFTEEENVLNAAKSGARGFLRRGRHRLPLSRRLEPSTTAHFGSTTMCPPRTLSKRSSAPGRWRERHCHNRTKVSNR